ncbi:MAG: hypothetical protein Q8N69_03475 [bacterium]|nr:hypothetical protein [bacterium]
MDSKRGVSLYISIIIMTALLSIVLGLSAILTNQLKMIRGLEKSVVALSAADAGVERALVDIAHNYPIAPHGPDAECLNNANYCQNLTNGASYETFVSCCSPLAPLCTWDAVNPCPGGLVSDPDCYGYLYCVKSVGKHKDASRALWVDI